MPEGFWRKKYKNNNGAKIWYTRIRLPDGRTVKRSTRCTDLAAARVARRRLEREAMAQADPATNQATKPYPVGQALADFMTNRERLGRAAGTIESYNTKSKHLVRLLGANTDVNSLQPTDIEAYADQRLEEGASHHTVKKELITITATLRVAKTHGYFRGDIDTLKLQGFSAKYVPRDRRLTIDEFTLLEGEFPPDRARHLRFFVLSGANLGEATRCERRDVDLANGYLYLPGTKRETRRRRLPFGLLPGLSELLDAIVSDLPAGQTTIFSRWSNMRRDIAMACERVGIDRVSPNDLRRTFGSWLKNRGLDSAVIARLMGHSTTRMVDQVYGQLDDDTLAHAMAKLRDLDLAPVPGAKDTEAGKATLQPGPPRPPGRTEGEQQGEHACGYFSTSSTSSTYVDDRADRLARKTRVGKPRKI